MYDLLSELGKESVKVSKLEAIYAANCSDQNFVPLVFSAMRQLDAELAWRAVWLLKRHARKRKLTERDLVQLTQYADELPHWAARLNLCQLFGTTGCPIPARETLYPYLVESLGNRRPMIRAWAISVLAGFREDKRYRKEVSAMLRKARSETHGSIMARLRHIK